mmetsp:Transcript_33666/g.49885  ORF Transcript_33666/g.49885 Transcript_33666/m.49885 type:complete len:168 (+) Transcript_33666:78-581(+)
MAGAAAKKAAAARAAAKATYQPLLIGVNAAFLLWQIVYAKATIWSVLGIAASMGLSYVAYSGILTEAETHKTNSKDLAGGIYLDLLGLVMLVQVGTCLVSSYFYALLLLVPVVGGWKLYKTFRGAQNSLSGGSSSGGSKNESPPTPQDEALEAKRQKRAERRRQKRS